MQAVVIAAGLSKRFWPFNTHTKSLFHIMGKPIIFYTLKSLEAVGVKEVIIVQKGNKEVEKSLSKYKFKIKVRYVCQKEQKGTAHAIFLAKKFIKGDFLFLSGHKVDIKDYYKKLLQRYRFQNGIVMSAQKIASQQAKDNKYHTLTVKDDKVLKISEQYKGKECLKVNEVYILTKDFLNTLEKFKDKEKGLIDALNYFIKGNEISYIVLDKHSLTLKYPWHLFAIKDYIFNKFLTNKISKGVKMGRGVVFNGKVFVEKGAVIGNDCVLEGNIYIGENSRIGDFNILRGNIDIEDNFKSKSFLEVKNSIICTKSKFHGGYVGDSIIGSGCSVGHGILTCNLLLSKKSVRCLGLDTKMEKLGLILGEKCRLGAGVCTMPGTIIGNNCKIYPCLKIKGLIKNNSVIKDNLC